MHVEKGRRHVVDCHCHGAGILDRAVATDAQRLSIGG